MKPATPFAAVLLAGGRSRRMGCDKALLPFGDGRQLWQRQLDDVLRRLAPAELLISGPARAGFPPDARLVPDAVPGLGPLGGIAASLAEATAPLVLVLAIDLPLMTADYLGTLLLRSEAGMGAVPLNARGLYEPLAAVYPKESGATATAQLATTDRSMQSFVRTGIAQGWLSPCEIAPADAPLFTNWNTNAAGIAR